MTEPLDYRVLLGLQAALEAIKHSAGFFFTVAGSAVKFEPNTDIGGLVLPAGARPFVLIQVLPESWEFFERPDGLRQTLRTRVHWVHESMAPTSDLDRMLTYTRGCADVERALAPSTGDRSLGGQAYDVRITGRRLEDTDISQVWAVLDVSVIFHRTYGRPLGD